MSEPVQPTTREGSSWWAARWLLIGVLVAGVLGMHILSQHESSGGHGLVMQSAASAPQVDHTGSSFSRPAASANSAAGSTPADPGSGSIAACILALVVVVGLVWLLRRRLLGQTPAAATLPATRSRRGPPLLAPSPLSLCVLRV